MSEHMTSHKEQPAVGMSAEKIEEIARSQITVRDLILSKRGHLIGKFEGLNAAIAMLDSNAVYLRSLAAHPAEPAGTAGIELETTAEERERWAAGYGGHALAMLARDFVRLSTQLRDAQARGKGMEEALKPIRQRLKAALHRDPDCTDYANLAIAEQCVATALDDIDAALSRPEGSASK